MNGEHLVLREQNLPPGGEWNADATAWVFLHVHSGEGLFLQTGSQQLLKPSDVLVCTPAAACRVRASVLSRLQLHYFQIRPELLVGVLSAFEHQQLTTLTLRPDQSARWFRDDTEIARRFTSLCEAKTAALNRRCQMLQLAAPILCEFLPVSAPDHEGFLSAKDRFERLFRDMPEAELQYRTPQELALQCGCSVRHFSRLFRKYFGHSLMPKKTGLRIKKAKQLLVETDSKIIDVALDCGFQNVSLFTSTFRRRTGQTPSEWRRRCRVKQRRS